MKVVSVVSARSNSGKTTVIEHLVAELVKRGYSVATIKHIPKANFTVDKEGSDTWKHARAGAGVVVGLSPNEAAFIVKTETELSVAEVLEKLRSFGSFDFVLIEGFRKESYPKIVAASSEEDARSLVDGATLAVSGVVAGSGEDVELGVPVIDATTQAKKLADLLEGEELRLKSTVAGLPGLNCGECGSESCADMAARILRGERSLEDCVVLSAGKMAEIKISGREVPMGSFVQELVRSVVLGMVSTLKKADAEDGDVVEIKVRV
ncbi:molybdopterin-guanine dinucleotide biosynthesis protein B [Candidatus Pyrohabitans sp.]